MKLAARKSDCCKLEEIEVILNMIKVSIEKSDANLGAEADIKFHNRTFD